MHAGGGKLHMGPPLAGGHVVLDGGAGRGQGAVPQPQQRALKVALPGTPQAVGWLVKGQGLALAQRLGHGSAAGQAVHGDRLHQPRWSGASAALTAHDAQRPRTWQTAAGPPGWLHVPRSGATAGARRQLTSAQPVGHCCTSGMEQLSWLQRLVCSRSRCRQGSRRT